MDNMAVTDNRVNDMSISPISIRYAAPPWAILETSPLAFKKSPSFLSKIPDFDDLDRAFVLVIDRGTERVPILQINQFAERDFIGKGKNPVLLLKSCEGQSPLQVLPHRQPGACACKALWLCAVGL